MGDWMSPLILTMPSKRPMKLPEDVPTGTSFATGRPLFVIRIGSLVVRTSSISVRHFALKAAAAIVFMVTL